MKRIAIAILCIAAIVLIAASSAADSLWPASRTAATYADKCARAVGDLLTIIIVESSAASHEAESQTDKSESANAARGTGLLRFFQQLGLSAKRSTAGSGSTTRKTELADRMTVRVTELLPNGALRIEGTRATLINAEKLEASLTGVVRQQDIGPDNTVLSTAIADQKLTWSGKGPIAEKQKPGIISWLLHFLF